ncbi:MAG: bifunctional ADP-dependent NAD(P)H-hydrate dehydratase/NAD(P)H-hydrate epimerase [Acidobacteria bacterium]|nr:bifunctional ADP-dependent NAD(P)H-hydrate dehydratase/NAD(P)H-hydrate epimerase [Acidobacteriota bacterium]|tara:strand:- start:644 stop:2260 length:1617 start_codon:yes stop_codon:yes gene_type:complete
MRVLNNSQMRQADRLTIRKAGMSSLELMERAGRQVAEAMVQQCPKLDCYRVAVVAGKGNNGGDGFVVARALADLAEQVCVCLLVPTREIKGDAAIKLSELSELGVPVFEADTPEMWADCRGDICANDVIVDALLGTGLARPIEGHYRTVVADLNQSGVPIISIDIPSGLSGDMNLVFGDSIDARMTVTLGAPKVPLLMTPTSNRVGALVLADIGIPDSVLEEVTGPRIEVITSSCAKALLPTRAADAHKGDFGRVLLVAGSAGKIGAACLAGMGALRSGAGLVTVATPETCRSAVSSWMPEYMTLGLDDSGDGRVKSIAVDKLLQEPHDVLAVGPGLGLGAEVTKFVQTLVRQSVGPLVLDADALNAFAGDSSELCGGVGCEIVITPHPGEMARLVGIGTDEVQASRIEVASEFAKARQIYVVLKGARTVVATPGGNTWINVTGNAGMATGGTGDLLTGVISSWIAQSLNVEQACVLGVFLHGLAGDLAVAKCGQVALLASDVGDHLGVAVLDLQAALPRDRQSIQPLGAGPLGFIPI